MPSCPAMCGSYVRMVPGEEHRVRSPAAVSRRSMSALSSRIVSERARYPARTPVDRRKNHRAALGPEALRLLDGPMGEGNPFLGQHFPVPGQDRTPLDRSGNAPARDHPEMPRRRECPRRFPGGSSGSRPCPEGAPSSCSAAAAEPVELRLRHAPGPDFSPPPPGACRRSGCRSCQR